MIEIKCSEEELSKKVFWISFFIVSLILGMVVFAFFFEDFYDFEYIFRKGIVYKKLGHFTSTIICLTFMIKAIFESIRLNKKCSKCSKTQKMGCFTLQGLLLLQNLCVALFLVGIIILLNFLQYNYAYVSLIPILCVVIFIIVCISETMKEATKK